jgi:hypothetical protein
MFTLWSHVEEAVIDLLRPERRLTTMGHGYAVARGDETQPGKYLDPRRRTAGEEGTEEHEQEARKAVIGALARFRGEKAPKAKVAHGGRLRTPDSAQGAMRRTIETEGKGSWAEDHYPDERYFALNGMSLFRLGTIEIRAFEGTSNAEDLVCWGLLWAAFTDATKGMTRDVMLKLLRKSPRTVLLDAAPNARVKAWLRHRWKLYAPAESKEGRARHGLRYMSMKPVTKKKAKKKKKLQPR